MLRIPPALLILAAACGCPHQPPPEPREPPPVLPLVALGLDGAAAVAYAVGTDDDPGRCVAGRTVGAILSAAAHGVRTEVYPPLVVDLTGCPGDRPGVDVPAYAEPLLTAGTRVARAVVETYPGRLGCRDAEIVGAALRYVEGAVPAIVAEVGEPDGYVEIEGATIDPCDTDAR